MAPIILAGVLAQMPVPVKLESAWQAFATADLKEIRHVLEENHPGPVDSENRFYAQRLNANYQPALELAAAAKNFFDYKRALLFYTNGFRDGHTVAYFRVDVAEFDWAPGFNWPGFAVRRDERGAFRVQEVDSVDGVKNGDELLSCDGITIDALMKARVDPFYWNADIPHERWLHFGRLFTLEVGDHSAGLRSCRFKTSAGIKNVALEWRPVSRERAGQLRARPSFGNIPELRRLGDIWHVVIPTFHYQTPEHEARIKQLIADIRSNAPAMRTGKVLLDVRGNGGGSSGWGREVAQTLWGNAQVSRVEQSFDWTVDWRASHANVAVLDKTVARYEQSGLADRAAGVRRTRNIVAAALADGSSLARVPSPPQQATAPLPGNPFTGRAFVLTDGACASACLDFLDIVRRLPNVTHIGWPTSADAIYIDNNNVTLPSGLAGFAYSMKVYRNRVRDHNEWYEPSVKWPGGPMTEESLRRWVEDL